MVVNNAQMLRIQSAASIRASISAPNYAASVVKFQAFYSGTEHPITTHAPMPQQESLLAARLSQIVLHS